MSENKNNKVINSMKWTMITEILAKLILPVTNMLLARILVPEDFGALAIINMFLTGIDIFTDAGFGKYLVQKDFENEQDKKNAENVAFWTNFTFSITIGLLLVIFSNKLASFFNNPDLSPAFKVISLPLILTSFSSIQQNILRRNFEFKKLFYIRLILTFVPLVVTLPLAYFTKSFWALIIGQLVNALLNTILLMLFGKWRPNKFYSFDVLNNMLGFSIWSMCEAIGHWLLFWIDTFFASYFFSEYYLGLYKNTQNMIFSIFSIITASMGTVLFSTLSRINDEVQYNKVYLGIQKLVSYLLFPMSFGLIFFSRNVTLVLLGERWLEASNIFMAGGFMMLFNTLFYTFPAEVYKSKGIPKQLFILQLEYLLFLLPIVYLSSKMGFWHLVYARSASILIMVALSMLKLKKKVNLSPRSIFKNLSRPFFASLPIIILGILYYFSKFYVDGTLKNAVVILVVGLIQAIWLLFTNKKEILNLVKKLN